MTCEIQHYFTLFNDDFGQFETQQYDWFLNPVVTPVSVKAVRDAYQLPQDVTTYNAVFDRIHKATLDFLTVSFAGRQTGRRFLLICQSQMAGKTPLDYDNQILLDILHQLNFQVSDFVKAFPYAKTSLSQSQRNYHSEQLNTLPASFIYQDSEAFKIEQLPQSQICLYLNQKAAEL